MKPFVFKLQTAYDIKLREEDMQKEELHRVTELYEKNLRILEGLKNRMIEIHAMVRDSQQQEVDVLEIRRCQDYIPFLNERIKEQAQATENRRLEMEQARQILVQIMQKRKILEKLKEKHYREYVREFLREEQKEIDEIATSSYIHKDSVV